MPMNHRVESLWAALVKKRKKYTRWSSFLLINSNCCSYRLNSSFIFIALSSILIDEIGGGREEENKAS